MSTAPVECFELYGHDAPECENCEGAGIEIYLHGPHERHRECPDCAGTGHALKCPGCTDGTGSTGGTCPVCDGHTFLL
jgi:DnaJ-class molecular chaperone